jgi:hypothetical protein
MIGAVAAGRAGQLVRRAVVAARAGASILRDELGLIGWLGAGAIVASMVVLSLGASVERDARDISAAAAELRADARRAALARARPGAARPEPARVDAAAAAAAALDSALPSEPQAGAVLPPAFFTRAERGGLKLGAVEYRWTRRTGEVQRVDVQFTATGRYLPTRKWLAETLAAMPHAQMVDLVIQRADPADPELEIRMLIAVHFKARA